MIQFKLNMEYFSGIIKMDFLEPIIELACLVVESSDSPKGCLFGILFIAALLGAVALLIYLT